MNNILYFKNIGTIAYSTALEIQEDYFKKKLNNKNFNIKNTNDILICEHPHVYTLGKSGNENNLLINSNFLKKINASYHKTNRGGDITYHGPGQVVVYPIIDLENFKIGSKEYIYKLEYLIIDILKKYNIKGEISKNNIGVWLDVGKKTERKICSIGVKISRGITMHGFALNVNTDLSYFNHINPCGFINKKTTSIKNELGLKIDLKEIINYIKLEFYNYFFNN